MVFTRQFAKGSLAACTSSLSMMHTQDDVQSLEAENFSLDQRCSSLQMQQEKLAKEFHQ